ncbi:hypothetical protein LTS15_009173 [Exophiala xenobiotica]|nr:hypothetical protein LTS15_009173 [Exophiala xenobiotica]
MSFSAEDTSFYALLPDPADTEKQDIENMNANNIPNTLLNFTPLCVASSFLFYDRTVICHNKQSLAVTIGTYGGFAAWTGGPLINNLFNENQITDSEYREWARSTAFILWAYMCGILYTRVFSFIYERCRQA